MDKELTHYYNETFGMMATEGWKLFVEDMTKLQEAVKDLETVVDANDLYYRKGQLDILNLILNRKKVCEQVYKELTE
jgi:tetrahydromethanopterin S-methyltransferase subunit B